MLADTRIPSGLTPERQKTLEIALSELKVGEVPPRSNRGPCEKFFPQWQINQLKERDQKAGKIVQGPAWCAFYATWCAHQALNRHILGAHVGSVHAMVGRAIERGLWIPLDTWPLEFDTVIAPGDLFCQLSEPYDPKKWCTGHTGIVLRTNKEGNKWNTVEGNAGDLVRIGNRLAKGPRMRGVISLTGDHGRGNWERGLIKGEDLTGLSTR